MQPHPNRKPTQYVSLQIYEFAILRINNLFTTHQLSKSSVIHNKYYMYVQQSNYLYFNTTEFSTKNVILDYPTNFRPLHFWWNINILKYSRVQLDTAYLSMIWSH